ncbi:MAG TPA: ABC transporter permease [Candidatus Ozemobacteraceae bacterium]|nr:ABC transporter permease [Candidatus Ozemobacteraceae bacterium]
MDSLTFIVSSFSGALRLLIQADAEVLAILWLSLKIAVVSTVGATLVAIPIAWHIHLAGPRWRYLFSLLFQVLAAIPTVIIGTVCFLLLSRNGPLGALELLYTPTAIIVGDLLLAIPLVALFLISALSLVPKGIFDTARNLGAHRLQLVRVVFNECREALLIAVCTAFGRVVSEVGAAMILGGNIRGVSRTMTTAISLEIGKGETELSIALGLILLGAALANAFLIGHAQYFVEKFRHRDLTPVSSAPTSDTKSLFPANRTPPTARLTALSKSFANPLFQNLTFELPLEGGTSLQGRSGCGKTTLFRLLAGLETPDTGTIEVTGRVVLVFQRPYLFHGSVADNLLFPSRLRGMAHDEAIDSALRLARSLEIAHLLSHPVRHLSAGEAARASFGRALAAQPDLLLIDETLVHLDAESLKPICATLEKFVASGGRFVLTTHQPSMALQLCHHHLFLADGRLIEVQGADLQHDTPSVETPIVPKVM